MEQLLQKKKNRRLATELAAAKSGFRIVIGVDEAGRGPLAGPVAAAALALLDLGAADAEFRFLLEAVNDSKKVAAGKREIIYKLLTSRPDIAWGFSWVGPRVIDKINIFEASKLAMRRAVEKLAARIPAARRGQIFCLIDGNFPIGVAFRQRSVVGGDAKIFSISGASIIAKVGRDRIMAAYDRKYPGYGLARHKGYPTAAHRRALAHLGLTPIHRRSFAPCAARTKKVII